MADCLKCGGHAADYSFRVLEVQTLHVRDLTGEKRVQALGLFQDYSVCRSCAQACVDRTLRPGRTLAKKLAPYAAALLFGVAVSLVFRGGDTALRLLGLAGILCGVLGIVSTLRSINEKRRGLAALSPEEALRQAAWACLLEAAPRKDGDNDLTYIPVDEKTMAMKNGDLMIVYDLLPAVAKRAWDLLHGVEGGEQAE